MAGKEGYPFGFAMQAIRNGMSARAGLAAYRQAGGSIRDATWFKMVGEGRAQVARRGAEVSAPLNRRPLATEITTWTTRTRSGYAQQVEVIVRDKDTGLIMSVPHTTTGQRLLTRQDAIDTALANFGGGNDEIYRQEILGATYVGTMLMQPEDN